MSLAWAKPSRWSQRDGNIQRSSPRTCISKRGSMRRVQLNVCRPTGRALIIIVLIMGHASDMQVACTKRLAATSCSAIDWTAAFEFSTERYGHREACASQRVHSPSADAGATWNGLNVSNGVAILRTCHRDRARGSTAEVMALRQIVDLIACRSVAFCRVR